MDAFFAITLSAFFIYKTLRSKPRRTNQQELRRNTVKARWDRKRIQAERIKHEAKLARKSAKERQKQADAELISVILPTINNDGK